MNDVGIEDAFQRSSPVIDTGDSDNTANDYPPLIHDFAGISPGDPADSVEQVVRLRGILGEKACVHREK